jgi:hypothetical protein
VIIALPLLLVEISADAMALVFPSISKNRPFSLREKVAAAG